MLHYFIALLFIVLSCTTQVNAQGFGDYLIARQAQQERDWDIASEAWDKFLKENKNYPSDNITDLRSRASLTALAAGEYDKAIAAAQHTLEHEKDKLAVFDKMILASYAVKSDDMALAKTVLKDIEAEAFQQLVIPTIENYLKKGDEESDRLNFAAALRDLSKLFLQEDRQDSTLLFARLAYYLAPDLDGVDLLLADTLYQNDNYDAAYQIYLKVTPDNDEHFVRSRLLAARSLRQLGRTDDAINLLNDTQKSSDNIDVIYELGDYYRFTDQPKQAVSYYTQVIKSFGKDIPKKYAYAHYLRAIAYENLKEWKKAETDLMRALEHFPNDPHILNYLGYGWIDRGTNLDKGEELIRQALEIEPNDGYITDSLGWALYKKGKYEDAVIILEKAVELVPYDPILNDHLGDAYWQVGRKQEARFQWERALNNKEEDHTGALVSEDIEQKLTHGLN